jgi:nucleotide-binding universal stress UspA family protein
MKRLEQERSMYKTILVPLDGSPRAEVILPHVEQLAARFEATVVLLTVAENVSTIPQSPENQPEMYLKFAQEGRDAAHAYLKAKRGELRGVGVDARARVAQGPVVEAIIEIAAEEEADLIAMASHGRTGLAQVFYGSVAAGVLQRVDRPLLLIRA